MTDVHPRGSLARPPLPDCSPIGYARIVREHDLRVLPHWRWTYVHKRHRYHEIQTDGIQHVVLPPPRAPGERDVDHLLYALRNEGLSLPIWRAWIGAVGKPEAGRQVSDAIHEAPTGSYARKAWYLFEELSGQRLDVPDLKRGNYVPLLDPQAFVTGPVRKHRRQRIDVNLLGDLEFSPIVRRDDTINAIDAGALTERIQTIVAGHDDATVMRAISYLYTRETMASFEIEHERPARSRAERFVALLRQAGDVARLDQPALVRLQNKTVDPRFARRDWRSDQVYVGEALDLIHERVHYVAPRPGDVHELMARLLALAELLSESDEVDAVVFAAVISFAFVLIHPFDDGNGRLHRWLIHWALVRRNVTPEGVIVPVSAVMLARRRDYDETLETFSRPLMERIEYELDDQGRLTVDGDTVALYRHPDLTAMAVSLNRWLTIAVDEELSAELDFLVSLERARESILDIVDMPDRLVILFIKVCRQHGGRLSSRKHQSHFSMLSDDEVGRMEQVVGDHFIR